MSIITNPLSVSKPPDDDEDSYLAAQHRVTSRSRFIRHVLLSRHRRGDGVSAAVDVCLQLAQAERDRLHQPVALARRNGDVLNYSARLDRAERAVRRLPDEYSFIIVTLSIVGNLFSARSPRTASPG